MTNDVFPTIKHQIIMFNVMYIQSSSAATAQTLQAPRVAKTAGGGLLFVLVRPTVLNSSSHCHLFSLVLPIDHWMEWLCMKGAQSIQTHKQSSDSAESVLLPGLCLPDLVRCTDHPATAFCS